MAVFNLICKIIFFVCLGWSAVVLIYFFIRRCIERRKAKKEALSDEVRDTTENIEKEDR